MRGLRYTSFFYLYFLFIGIFWYSGFTGFSVNGMIKIVINQWNFIEEVRINFR